MLQSPTVKGATITELDSESIYIHVNSGHDLCSGDGAKMPCSFLEVAIKLIFSSMLIQVILQINFYYILRNSCVIDVVK